MRPNFYQRRATPNFGRLPAVLGRLVRYGIYVLIVYAVWGFAKRAWDCRSAGQLAGAATAELEVNGPDAAKEILREAFSLCPENPKAARVMAGLLNAEGSTQAVAYHLIVLESGEATDADRRAMIDSALMHGEESGALEKALEVAGELGDPALPHLVKARIHERRGEAWESEQELRRAVAKRPASDTWTALARGLMANAGTNDGFMNEILGLLRRAALADRGEGGLEAIELAMDSGLLSRQAMGEWLEMHQSHPAADTASRLKVGDMVLSHTPELRDEIVERVLFRSRELPVEEKILVARWLVDQGAAGRVGGFWAMDEAARGGRDAFLAWIGAATVAGDWGAVDDALEHTANPLENCQSLAIRSNTAFARGDAERAASLASSAVSACGGDPEARVGVVRLFLEGGNFPAALGHVGGLLSDPVASSMVVGELVPLVTGGRSARESLAFYEEILKARQFRQDPQLRGRADRLRVLAGGDVSEAELQELLKQTESPSPRLTLAMFHLLQGRVSRAGYELALIDSEIDPGKMSPPDRAAMAVLLAAGGRLAEAREMAAGVGRDEVSIEEFALIERHVRGTAD